MVQHILLWGFECLLNWSLNMCNNLYLFLPFCIILLCIYVIASKRLIIRRTRNVLTTTKATTLKTNGHIVQDVPHTRSSDDKIIYLNGNDLTTETLFKLGDFEYKIKLSKDSENNVKDSRELVESICKKRKPVYAINTGVGNFSNVTIAADKIEELQYNIIRSHAAGVGTALSFSRTRMMFALRINILSKGYSGISLKSLQHLVDIFNALCIPWVPQKGSVGASGDLAPLAHLALGFIGEGKMWSPKTGWNTSINVLKKNGLVPLRLGPKEGIALINGTQFMTSIGAEAVERAAKIALQADVVAALTLEALKGSCRPFDEDVHLIRPHKGQIGVAGRLRALLHSETNPSKIAEHHKNCNKVQDAYSLRCCPQVHGIVQDTIEFVKGIINTEINSATDNPLVFANREEIISAGNFHGEYPAKALDYLAIAVHELASMSERRIERLVNSNLSQLPAFLTKNGGLNSGFMIVQCTAAALVSENKVLCHPSSVDNISTNAGQEDHVSMGCFSARKALEVIENVENVIAIELLTACQALDFLRPLKSTKPLEDVHSCVRNFVGRLDDDRYMTPDIEAVKQLLDKNIIWSTVEPHIKSFTGKK